MHGRSVRAREKSRDQGEETINRERGIRPGQVSSGWKSPMKMRGRKGGKWRRGAGKGEMEPRGRKGGEESGGEGSNGRAASCHLVPESPSTAKDSCRQPTLAAAQIARIQGIPG